MQPVGRDSLLDYVTYEERRDAIRRQVFAVKALRRVHVAGVLTFLFENADTVRYQVQEMMRAERIVKEGDIAHELATYNELLGGPGELGATLLIEIEDPVERSARGRAGARLRALRRAPDRHRSAVLGALHQVRHAVARAAGRGDGPARPGRRNGARARANRGSASGFGDLTGAAPAGMGPRRNAAAFPGRPSRMAQ
jgi:hypothetical protein